VPIAALLVLGLSVDAHACRTNPPPEQELARGYEAGAIKAIALVRVETAHYANVASRDAHQWSAHGRVVRPLLGTDLPGEIEFGPGPCVGRRAPEPKPGDAWVVYLWIDHTGQHVPWLALTLDEAREFDPVLNGRL
tara:strand:- start:780 stop:1187 length:408 start_codon:yes stop_codon:yes gene_type:complete